MERTTSNGLIQNGCSGAESFWGANLKRVPGLLRALTDAGNADSGFYTNYYSRFA